MELVFYNWRLYLMEELRLLNITEVVRLLIQRQGLTVAQDNFHS